MKVDQKKVATIMTVVISFLSIFVIGIKLYIEKDLISKEKEKPVFNHENTKIIHDKLKDIDVSIQEEIRKANIVYDNMTMEELSQKLEKSMNSSLKGKGELFATYSIELGLDPYLALAIVLHETGCSYSCSSLVRTHNNLGGLKAGNGKYMYFNTLDEGIKGYLKILYDRYYSKGLTTPELMNPSYAESTAWASRVNYYMKKIKAK